MAEIAEVLKTLQEQGKIAPLVVELGMAGFIGDADHILEAAGLCQTEREEQPSNLASRGFYARV